MKANRSRLYEIAERQHGFFTTKQARLCGYVSSNHPYHVRTGEWVREYRGIYRLARYPRAPEDQLVLWALWSRGRNDSPVGVYSHQTALSLHELADLMPAKLHMTVPLAFRKTAEVPKILVLHKASVEAADIEEREGYRIVKPLQAIVGILDEGSEERSRLRNALREALNRGLITRRQIEQYERRREIQALLGGKPA